MSMLIQARKELLKHADKKKAVFLLRFFKTGEGQYAAGDKFLGIVVPVTRSIAKKYKAMPLNEVFKLLQSPLHEERMLALFILVDQYAKADSATQERIYKTYLKLASKHINNWDLVDLSADKIVGKHLMDKPKDILSKLAKSKNLWEKRIAIIATFYFIKNNKFADTLKIGRILLNDSQDLIHKAVGWMLREVGNRSLKNELVFLDKYAEVMPRTMLRYAIEKFPEKLRKHYLSAKARSII